MALRIPFEQTTWGYARQMMLQRNSPKQTIWGHACRILAIGNPPEYTLYDANVPPLSSCFCLVFTLTCLQLQVTDNYPDLCKLLHLSIDIFRQQHRLLPSPSTPCPLTSPPPVTQPFITHPASISTRLHLEHVFRSFNTAWIAYGNV